MQGLFTGLSREELEGDTAAVAATPITAEEVVEESMQQDAINTIVAETVADVKTLENSENTLEAIEEKIEENTTKIETAPETVTAADVMVAQESLRLMAMYLDAPAGMVKVDISHESAQANPATNLEVSNESAKDFVKQVVETIKALFVKILANVKKLYAEAVVMLSQTKNRAIKLKAGLEAKGDAPTGEFTEGEVSTIVDALGLVIFKNGKALNDNPTSVLGEYLDGVNNPSVLTKIAANTVGIGHLVAAILKDENSETSKKMVEGMGKIITDGNKGNKFSETIADTIKADGGMEFTFTTATPNTTTELAVYRMDGKGARYMFLAGDNVDDIYKKLVDGKYIEGIGMIRYGNGTASIKPEVLKTFKVAVPTKAAIGSLLDQVITVSGGSKAFSDAAIAEINNTTKALDEIMKVASANENLTPLAKASISRFTSVCRMSVTNIGMQAILGQIAGTKSVLGYCVAGSKKYGPKA